MKENVIVFSVPTNRIKRIIKNGEEITKTMSNNSQFIDGVRFMTRSLSNLIDNFAEEIDIKLNVNMDMI